MIIGNKLTAWAVVLAALAVTAGFFVLLAGNIRIETDLDKYMPQEHPAFVYSNQAEEWFDIKDGIIIAIEHPQTLFNPGTLGKIRDLTLELQEREEFEEVDVTSVYTADNIQGTEDGLDVQRFYEDIPEDAEGLEHIRQAVMGNEMIAGKLVSADGTIALIVAAIQDKAFSPAFYKEIRELARSYEGPERLYVAGRPVVEGTMAALGMADMRRMAPLVILVIAAVLYLLLRSVRSTLLTLLVVLMSAVWTFGLMALLGVPVYAVSTMIPVMLIAIGVAYGIHLFSQLHLIRQEDRAVTSREALRRMLRGMWKPVLMTALTTAVGFISLVTSQVYPVKYFGLFTAFGVMVALLLSLVFIPAGVTLLGLPGPARGRGSRGRAEAQREPLAGPEERTARRFALALLRRRGAVFAAAALVLAVSVFGITRVWINSSFLDNFEAGSEIARTDRFINQHFGGTSTLNVILEGEAEGVFKEPEVLALVDRLQARAESLPDVGNSFSLADYLRRMNRVMHEDRPEFDAIPSSRELVAQYLLLYEMSGDPQNLERVVDYDYRQANLTLQLKNDDSRTIEAAIAAIEELAPELEKLGIRLNYAGSGYKSLVFTRLILSGQISSLLLSVGIVILLVALMFRSLRAGLIGAVPIALTAIVNFGVMGLLGIPLSTTTALISSIAVGIGVDYAIHFIDRYRLYTRKLEPVEAAARTMHHTGRAILMNAVVVIAGFLVLLASVFPPNRSLGALVSFSMFTSFLGTVTLMFLILAKRAAKGRPKHAARSEK
ncbi:MAG: hypothetical protein A2064_05790 [Spirochaetes bacterium GWB1_66_5]|nr:MAG: hypothetical protein A2064_05790 [Spirochaetes bacterium GWB1_66_5]